MQRILDLIIASSLFLLLLPLFIIISLILKITGEGEVFFSQERIGRYGNQINILKFATMLKNSPNIGAGTVTLKNDIRILPFGRFLRKTKINELPQLINIIRGEMSFIGPRPQTQRCFAAYPESSQKIIIQVRPGLSGVGSIFFRNEEDMLVNTSISDEFYDCVIMPYKGRLEEWYVSNQSIKLYFLLCFITLLVVVTGRIFFLKTKFSSIPTPPKKLENYFSQWPII